MKNEVTELFKIYESEIKELKTDIKTYDKKIVQDQTQKELLKIQLK